MFIAFFEIRNNCHMQYHGQGNFLHSRCIQTSRLCLTVYVVALKRELLPSVWQPLGDDFLPGCLLFQNNPLETLAGMLAASYISKCRNANAGFCHCYLHSSEGIPC